MSTPSSTETNVSRAKSKRHSSFAANFNTMKSQDEAFGKIIDEAKKQDEKVFRERINKISMDIDKTFHLPHQKKQLCPYIDLRRQARSIFDSVKNQDVWIPLVMSKIRFGSSIELRQGKGRNCLFEASVVWCNPVIKPRGIHRENAVSIFELWDDSLHLESQMREQFEEKQLEVLDAMLECCKEPGAWEKVQLIGFVCSLLVRIVHYLIVYIVK